MGTNKTKHLQKEVKDYLAKLKWSQKRFAREWYVEYHEIDNEDEMKSFQEKVKKDLSRDTTKAELLQSYLEFITQHDEFAKLDCVYQPYKSNGLLSTGIESGMAKISQGIEKQLLSD